jgi:hypothetical protein
MLFRRPAMQEGEERRGAGWRRILLESFFVMLGVLLALAADQWRESANQRRKAVTALASIREEVEANRKAVRQSLDYHVSLRGELLAFTRRTREQGGRVESGLPDRRIFSQGFIKPASLLHTAWEAANATEAVSHMEYADVLALARVYEQQRHYESQAEQVGELVYATLFHEGFEGMLRNHANLGSIISTFLYRECQLLEGYSTVSRHLDGPSGAVKADEIPEFCGRALGR